MKRKDRLSSFRVMVLRISVLLSVRPENIYMPKSSIEKTGRR